jgi:hypothetical protein
MRQENLNVQNYYYVNEYRMVSFLHIPINARPAKETATTNDEIKHDPNNVF